MGESGGDKRGESRICGSPLDSRGEPAAWAASIGLVDISNEALLWRLRQCGDWFALLVGHALTAGAPKAAKGRLIRIIDGATVAKAGKQAKTGNKVWRVQGAFDLPEERFGHFEWR